MDTITPEFDKLYCAYRRAKAHSDLAFYTLDSDGASVRDDESTALAHAQHNACNTLMLYPASNAPELAMKMDVFMQEELFEGTHSKAKAIAAALANDAQRIAYP